MEELLEATGSLDELGGLDEMGDLGEGLDEADTEALNDAVDDANEQFEDFSEEDIETVNNETPEEVTQDVNETVDSEDAGGLDEDQESAAKDEGKDPKKPQENLKTRLKKVWKQYGGFLKGIGKFTVKALGEYFKWMFIIQIVKTTQMDISALIKAIGGKPVSGSSTGTKMTSFLTLMNAVSTITGKIDLPLKIITGSSTTTDKDGLANLFANEFSLRASEVLIQSGSALLQAGQKVLLDNHNAFKALGLPKSPTAADLSKVSSATLSAAIKKLSVDNLRAFSKAAIAHQANLDKYLGNLGTSDDDKKLKAALALPPNYGKTFDNLITFLDKA